MTTDNLKKINMTLALKQVRREGPARLTGQERQDFAQIRITYDQRRQAAEELYTKEYPVRVEIARRALIDKAGAKTQDLKPRFFGIDRFNKEDLTRQAQLHVRFDHQQTMDRLDGGELKESRSFLERSSQREEFRARFTRAAERRQTPSRRQGQTRRRSQTMSG